MDLKFGLFIVLGLVIGSVFGVSLGAVIGNNAIVAIGIIAGPIGGVFLGWFVAAAVLKNRKIKNEDK